MEAHSGLSHVDDMEREKPENLRGSLSPLETLWNMFSQNIKESLLLHTWHEEDFPSLPQEQNIWANWNLQWNQES